MKSHIIARNVLRLTYSIVAVYMLTGCRMIVRQVVLHHPEVKKRLDLYVPDHTVCGRGWTNSVGEGTNMITVLHLDATNHYSQGYWQGKLLAPQIKGTIDDLYLGADRIITSSKLFKNSRIVRWVFAERVRRGTVDCLLDRSWKIMERYVPQADLDEMQGLADGLKAAGYGQIDLETIHRIHAFPDVTETSCSALIARGSATSDGHTYQIRILDYGAGSGLDRRPLITVYHPTAPQENAFIAIGWIGFVGLVTGMNEKHVAVSEMGYGNPPGETLAGEPMIFLVKRGLRYADSAAEIAAIIRSARRNNSYAYWVGDGSGAALGMVTSARTCREFRINGSDAISDVINGSSVTLPQFADVIYAGHQKEKQTPFVREMLGAIDIEHLKEHSRQIAMKSNLQAAIFDLTTGDAYVANRHGNIPGARCEYVLFPRSAWVK